MGDDFLWRIHLSFWRSICKVRIEWRNRGSLRDMETKILTLKTFQSRWGQLLEANKSRKEKYNEKRFARLLICI